MTNTVQGSANVSYATHTDANKSADLQKFDQEIQAIKQGVEKFEKNINSLLKAIENLKKMMAQYSLMAAPRPDGHQRHAHHAQPYRGTKKEQSIDGAHAVDKTEHPDDHNLNDNQIEFNATVNRLINEAPAVFDGSATEQQKAQYFRDSSIAGEIYTKLSQEPEVLLAQETKVSMDKLAKLNSIDIALDAIANDQGALHPDPASKNTKGGKEKYELGVAKVNVEYKFLQDSLKDIGDPKLTKTVNQILDGYYIPIRDDKNNS